LVAPISAAKLTRIIKETYATPEAVQVKLRSYLKPKSKIAKAKPTKVTTQIVALKKKGKVIEFKKDGKLTRAKVGRRTKVYIGKKKVKRKALKAGMTCSIAYFEGASAKTIKCK
jgi:hypothetical protein